MKRDAEEDLFKKPQVRLVVIFFNGQAAKAGPLKME